MVYILWRMGAMVGRSHQRRNSVSPNPALILNSNPSSTPGLEALPTLCSVGSTYRKHFSGTTFDG